MDNLDDWRPVVELWKAQKRDLRFLEVPPELAAQLGVPFADAKERRVIEEDEDMTEATGTAEHEPKWKRKKVFDGDECGYVKCQRKPDGYVPGRRSTAGAVAGALWYGPACTKCVRTFHPTLMPLTLPQLAAQRNGLSDLAIVLDLEVGEVIRRLDALGVDERGNSRMGAAVKNVALVGEAPSQTTTLVATDGREQHTIEVLVPLTSIESKKAEADATLSGLSGFYIRTQEQMDYVSGYLQKMKGLAKALEKEEKDISLPFKAVVENVKKRFLPAKKALTQVEAALKACIQEGMAWASAQQQASLGKAGYALASGDHAGVALATQQAVQADLNLSPGVTARKVIKWAVIDPSQVPPQLWSVDPAKVQSWIDLGYYQIPGVQVWEEPVLASTSTPPG